MPIHILQLLKPYDIPTREETLVPEDGESITDEEIIQNVIEGWNDDSSEVLATENEI